MARTELINRLNNLSDDETRCDLSDWAVNSLREAAREGTLKKASTCPCPNCGCGTIVEYEDLLTLVNEERARMIENDIPLNGDGLIPYLRSRRAGSRFRLSRKLREMVFVAVATRAAR